ncbi:MAG: phosphatase PAP2 family protein [Clostridia bacterium]
MKEKNNISVTNFIIITIPIIIFFILSIVIKFNIYSEYEGIIYYNITKYMSSDLTNIVIGITNIGGVIPTMIICLLLIMFSKTRFKYGIPISFSVIVATGLNLILKEIFCRQRPSILRLVYETNFSFPSGHAMVSSALYLTLIFFILKFVKSKYIKILISSLLSILIVLIGISRVYLGVHYSFDILGGWLMGFVIAFSSYLIFTKKYNLIKKDTIHII